MVLGWCAIIRGTDALSRLTSEKSSWILFFLSQIGAEALCGDPLCCRSQPGDGELTKRPAKWIGDYQCDSPAALVREVIRYAHEIAPNPDFIMSTGDLPPHDLWSLEGHAPAVRAEQFIADSLLNYTVLDVPVYMSIGNHENPTSNYFPSRDVPGTNITWLYKSVRGSVFSHASFRTSARQPMASMADSNSI